MTPAGDMTERVQFEAPRPASQAQDSQGQPTGANVDLGTVWAKVEQLPGGESFSDQEQALANYAIIIRRLSGTGAAVDRTCFAILGPRWGSRRLFVTDVQQLNRFDLLINATARP